jgi:AcrR family transcriptional regulator
VGPGNPHPVDQLRANLRRVVTYVLEERELTDILLNHSTGFDRDLDEKILNFYDRIAALIQRSLDLGIEMQLVRRTDTRAIAYCILGAIKEVVGLLSRGGAADTDKLVEEILDFGLRGVARPELLEAMVRSDEGGKEPGFLFTRG